MGGVPVGTVLRPLTVTVPPVMVPEPLQPVRWSAPEMVCWVGVLVTPGERVEEPDPPVQVSNVDAKAGVVPSPTAAAAMRLANATATLIRFNLGNFRFPLVRCEGRRPRYWIAAK
jgi:hypothetical protein